MSWYSSSSFIDTPPCAQFQRLERSSTKYHLSTVRWRGGCKKCGSVTISLLAMNVTGLSTFPPAPRPPLPPHNECQSTRRWWRWRYDGLQLQTSEKCSSAPDSNFLYSTGQPGPAHCSPAQQAAGNCCTALLLHLRCQVWSERCNTFLLFLISNNWLQSKAAEQW